MLKNDFYSYKCKSMRDLEKGDCDTSEYEMMGEYVSMEARGRYYVEVDKEAPYSKGQKGKSDKSCR